MINVHVLYTMISGLIGSVAMIVIFTVPVLEEMMGLYVHECVSVCVSVGSS